MTVVLITGALTGIGRATCPGLRQGRRPNRRLRPPRRHGRQSWSQSYARLAQRPNSSAPMFAMTKRCGA